MKAIVKKGQDILDLEFCHFDKLNNSIILNLKNKWIYESYTFTKHKKLTVKTTEGEILIIFSSNIHKVKFEYHEKNQVGFILIKGRI